MRRTKLSKYFAVMTALSMIAISPMTALAETVEQVTVEGTKGNGTYESVSNTEGKNGVEMRDGTDGTALNGNVTVKGNGYATGVNTISYGTTIDIAPAVRQAVQQAQHQASFITAAGLRMLTAGSISSLMEIS